MLIKLIYVCLTLLNINVSHAAALQTNMDTPCPTLSDLQADSPLGDNLHVSIYDFILVELMKYQNIPEWRLQEIDCQEKASLKDPQLVKPYVAEVGETQFSHILTMLCKGTESCRFLGIYQKDGLLIGLADPYVLSQHKFLKFYPPCLNTPATTLSFLSNPFQKLGVHKIECEKEFCEYLITWAIYAEESCPNEFIGNLSFDLPTSKIGEPIGFVRLIKTIKMRKK